MLPSGCDASYVLLNISFAHEGIQPHKCTSNQLMYKRARVSVQNEIRLKESVCFFFTSKLFFQVIWFGCAMQTYQTHYHHLANSIDRYLINYFVSSMSKLYAELNVPRLEKISSIFQNLWQKIIIFLANISLAIERVELLLHFYTTLVLFFYTFKTPRWKKRAL